MKNVEDNLKLKRENELKDRLIPHVICPNCKDPVAGKIPQPPEQLKLTCLNPSCGQTFAFVPEDIRRSLMSYNLDTRRWKALN